MLLTLFLVARRVLQVDEMIVEEEEEENKNKSLQSARVSRHSRAGLGADRRQGNTKVWKCSVALPELTV